MNGAPNQEGRLPPGVGAPFSMGCDEILLVRNLDGKQLPGFLDKAMVG